MTPRHPPRALSSLTYIKAHAQSRLKYQLVLSVRFLRCRPSCEGPRHGRRPDRSFPGRNLPASVPASCRPAGTPVDAKIGLTRRPTSRALPHQGLSYTVFPRAVSFKLQRPIYRSVSLKRKPLLPAGSARPRASACPPFLVEPRRFELLTSAVQRRRSPN